MKRILSLLLATLLIVCCFGMVGCKAEGVYTLKEVVIDGVSYKKGDTIPGYGELSEEKLLSAPFTFELGVDGAYLVNQTQDTNTSWTKEDKTVTITYNGIEIYKYTQKGRKLIREIDGAKFIYKRQRANTFV